MAFLCAADVRRQKILLSLCGFLALAFLLAGCGDDSTAGPLLSGVRLSNPTFSPGADSGPKDVTLSYKIGREATVTISVTPQQGQPVVVRQNERRSPDTYSFRFNGAVPLQQDGVTQDRVLPAGTYTLAISVTAGGETKQESATFSIIGNPPAPPEIQNVTATPETITPNFDAVDDLTTITYRVTKPATITVYVDGPGNIHRYLQAPTVKDNPSENQVIFNGLTENQEPLPNGAYTVTIEAADSIGNISRAKQPITVKDAGHPQAEITYAQIAPDQVMRGDNITITVRVKNTGTVPLRTQGPDPGFTYSTQDTFSSISNHQYDDKAGLWRIGVDFDGGGTAPGRYPFRWGFGHDLQPGEEVTVTGKITVMRTEDKLRFFVGLIQEQISLPQDHISSTWVKIS